MSQQHTEAIASSFRGRAASTCSLGDHAEDWGRQEMWPARPAMSEGVTVQDTDVTVSLASLTPRGGKKAPDSPGQVWGVWRVVQHHPSPSCPFPTTQSGLLIGSGFPGSHPLAERRLSGGEGVGLVLLRLVFLFQSVKGRIWEAPPPLEGSLVRGCRSSGLVLSGLTDGVSDLLPLGRGPAPEARRSHPPTCDTQMTTSTGGVDAVHLH